MHECSEMHAADCMRKHARPLAAHQRTLIPGSICYNLQADCMSKHARTLAVHQRTLIPGSICYNL